MKKSPRYAYSAEGHLYMLQPDFTVAPMRIHITGCQIYDLKGEYLGYWDRVNIPVIVLNSLLKFVHVAYAQDIARRQAAQKRNGDLSWLK